MAGVWSADILSALTTNYKAIFQDDFTAAAAALGLDQLAMQAPSGTDTEVYEWLGSVPQVVELLGGEEAARSALRESSYSLQNKEWGSSVEVQRKAIEDDKLGHIVPRIRTMAQKAARHKRALLITTLVANGLCYDGQNFFDTDHSEGDSGTQSNLQSSGSGTTVANLKTDLAAAIAAMRKFKDDRGRVMDIDPSGDNLWVVAPPDLEPAWLEVLNATVISQTTNVWQGRAKLLISGQLADATDWYLLYTGAAVKPLVMQNRIDPEFDADETELKSKRRIVYRTYARYNCGYLFWQYAYKTVNAG